MIAAGVQVHDFHSPWQSARGLSFLQMMNQRNHRKLVVIDDEIAYFGGMNVVDLRGIDSTEDAAARDLPKSAGWRDLHVRLAGPQQAEIALIMDRLWRRLHHQSNRGRKRPWPVKQMLAANDDAIFFFDSRPQFKYRRPQRIFVPLINRARHDITLSMAYFIPVGGVRRALVRARKRGVRVRVIIPAESDVSAVQYATRYFYHYLLKRGIHIYERNQQMLHGKAMVVDGLWSVIGSCNLDPRSLRINLEFVAAIRSRALATAVQKICRHEMLHSTRVTWDAYNRRTLWQRFVDRLAWAFRHWL
jgi:cardiolipin synthase